MRMWLGQILRPCTAAHTAALALIVCLAAVQGTAAGQRPGLWIPGGTPNLLAAAGLQPSRPRATAMLDLVRVLYEGREGLDPAADERRARLLGYLETLDDGGGAGDEVPLPLPEAVWRSLLAGRGPAATPLVSLILHDRNASLLYYGLFSMDEETRSYLASAGAALRAIYESDRAGVFALHGRSLRVRQGRIDTPGGPAATSLWEAVAGERASSPDRFILAVLGKDGGRLALIYDAVGHLDLPRQRFVLGLWLSDPEQRMASFRAFYSSCVRVLRCWRPAAWPFLHRVYDPVELLLLTRVAEDGRPASPARRGLWDKVFAGEQLPAGAETELPNLDKDGPLDAAWLIDRVVVTDHTVRRNRAEAWLFGQRVFGDAPDRVMAQVLVALRGYNRFRALAATLERLGITDPAVYVAAFRQAQSISAVGDGERGSTALALYQGCLVLVERARLSRVIDVAVAARLVASLARVPLSEDGEFAGRMASWIDTDYLPAIGRRGDSPVALDPAAGVEARVLGALAGIRAGEVAMHEIEHEGTRYRVDPAAGEFARLQAVRAKQGGASLDLVMAFAAEVEIIASGVESLAAIPRRVARLEASAAPLLAFENTAAGALASSGLARTLADAARALNRIRRPADLASCERIVIPLRRSIDRCLARVLLSLAYACSLGDPDSAALVAGDPSVEHDFGLHHADPSLRVRAAWAMPAQTRDSDGRWRVKGSLLALDVGLGDLALRRISTDPPPGAPTVTDNDRRAFTEAVVLANPFDYRDADMVLIADAIRRGRARVAGLAAGPALLPEVLAVAALDESRQQAVSWALAHEPSRVPSFFSLGELLRLGRLSPGSVEALDAWGTSGLSLDGRLCLHFPLTQPWTTLCGRRGKGLSATLVPDLQLMMAEALRDQRLPAALTRSLLAVATPQIVERLGLAFEDDWLAMVADIQQIVRVRFDDYLASVVTSGPLVPIAKGEDRAPAP